jgi:hypothetical protein
VYETFIAQSCSTDALAAAIARSAKNDAEYFAVALDDSTLVGYLDFGRDEDGILELRRLYAAVVPLRTPRLEHTNRVARGF